MILELSAAEKLLLTKVSAGISRILIFKEGAYPSAVSFELVGNEIITIRAKGVDVAPKFEVFPITVTNEMVNSAPEQVFELDGNIKIGQIEVLQKYEWDIPLKQDEKEKTFGNSENATLQCQGKSADIPNNAINQIKLDAGINLKNNENWAFSVATSMFPFSLYVSDCESSENFDLSIYDYKTLYS